MRAKRRLGATWAGPIARILIEKYLNDTIQEKSKADVERISKADLMPAYFKRLQFKTDSLRAVEWFQKTQDSSYLEKYTMMEPLPRVPGREDEPTSSHKETKMLAILPDKKYLRNKIHEYHRA